VQAFGIARQFQLDTQAKNLAHYDCNRVDWRYALGEKVWLHRPHMQNQHSKKLIQPWARSIPHHQDPWRHHIWAAECA